MSEDGGQVKVRELVEHIRAEQRETDARTVEKLVPHKLGSCPTCDMLQGLANIIRMGDKQ